MGQPRDITWLSRPGSWDPLHARHLYPGDAEHGIPLLEAPALPAVLPTVFTPWPARRRRPADAGLHFFTDDYRFEPVWKSPARSAASLRAAPVVLSPDFSLYAEWPMAMALWQVYRSRWLAMAIAELGATVIPAVTWGSADTHAFAFTGLPWGGAVAVTTNGRARTGAAWDRGYAAMVEAVGPSVVVALGPALPPSLASLAPVHQVTDTTLQRLRAIDGR